MNHLFTGRADGHGQIVPYGKKVCEYSLLSANIFHQNIMIQWYSIHLNERAPKQIVVICSTYSPINTHTLQGFKHR